MISHGEHRAHNYQFFLDILHEHLQGVREGLEAGVDIERELYSGSTAIFLASQKNSSPEISTLLVKKGAKLNVISNRGATPLHGFARNGWCDLLQEAIRMGCPIDAIDDAGNTALSLACREQQLVAIRLLIQHGAKAGLDLGNGRTVLRSAAGQALVTLQDLNTLS